MFNVYAVGFRAWGVAIRVSSLWFRLTIAGLGVMIQNFGLRSRVYAVGFKVYGLGTRQFTWLAPLTTTPSTGMRSPGKTKIRSSRWITDVGTFGF